MSTSKRQTVLLTGATGFLGSQLLEKLVSENRFSVVILKRTTSDCWRIEHLLNKVKLFNIDEDSLLVIFKSIPIDYIIHLATLYKKSDDVKDIPDMVESNIAFPASLIELGVHYGIKGFINTGTFFEYDCVTQPVNECAKIRPLNFYAKTKLAFENILKTYSENTYINTFRLFSPYGEKDNFKLIPMIINKALNHENISLSDGLQKLDFTYSGDIVNAYIRALNKIGSGPPMKGYSIYNLGSGQPISIREIVSVIEQHLGFSIDISWGKPSKVDISIAYADITKVNNELGWFPQFSIHKGIANTIKYYVNTNEVRF